MASEGGWRGSLFEKGAKYQVLKNWSARGSTFKQGAIVEFDSSGYERYDSESLFRFYEKSGVLSRKQELIWFIRDDEPVSKVNEYFVQYES
jgi:hypothetical protein